MSNRRVVAPDVIAELDRLMSLRLGTGSCDVNPFDVPIPVPFGLLFRVRREISELREAQTR
jgi:hypothetical protein